MDQEDTWVFEKKFQTIRTENFCGFAFRFLLSISCKQTPKTTTCSEVMGLYHTAYLGRGMSHIMNQNSCWTGLFQGSWKANSGKSQTNHPQTNPPIYAHTLASCWNCMREVGSLKSSISLPHCRAPGGEQGISLKSCPSLLRVLLWSPSRNERQLFKQLSFHSQQVLQPQAGKKGSLKSCPLSLRGSSVAVSIGKRGEAA